MLNKPLSLIGAGVLCASVLAQAPALIGAATPGPAASAGLAAQAVGTVVNVQGLVTVSHGSVITTAAENSTALAWSRYVASSNGSATLRFSGDCVLQISPGQALTVDPGMTCEKMTTILQAQNVVAPAAAAPAVSAAIPLPAVIGTVVTIALASPAVQDSLGIRTPPNVNATTGQGGQIPTIPDQPPSEQ